MGKRRLPRSFTTVLLVAALLVATAEAPTHILHCLPGSEGDGSCPALLSQWQGVGFLLVSGVLAPKPTATIVSPAAEQPDPLTATTDSVGPRAPPWILQCG